MDALTRISAFFPFKTITIYFIMSNVIINNVGDCQPQQRQLLIALLVIFCFLHVLSCFTDTYTATNGNKFWVFIIPFYGPLCFSLPSDYDKDRVYEYYYLRYRDYSHAFASVLTFILIIIFANPIAMCIFPSGSSDGTARFDAAIIRTVPILVGIIMSMLMVCLGPPRQMLGIQNVTETCPPVDKQMGDNPIFNKYPGPPHESSIPEGQEEEEEDGPVPQHPQANYKLHRGPSSRDGSRTPPHDQYSRGRGPPASSPRASSRTEPPPYEP